MKIPGAGNMKVHIEYYLHKSYIRWIRPRIAEEINRQRVKLIWDAWGYWPLLFLRILPLFDKLRLLMRCLIIDWHVVHCHKPKEMSIICHALAERRGNPGEAFLEAGCWQGGSSAKFSVICNMLGYRLCIYDSFEGVEPMTPEERVDSHHDFSREYAAAESVLRETFARFGEMGICSIHKGWFADTLATRPVPYRVRVAFIDCDLAKGTNEALRGIVPALVDDGWIFSQDFHLKPVQRLLCDPATWDRFGKGVPIITRLGRRLASIRFTSHAELISEGVVRDTYTNRSQEHC
jgi:O-methyltransferase